jgi:hypothetical protein
LSGTALAPSFPTDLIDADLGKLLPMPVLDLVSFPPFLFEDGHLVALRMAEDLSLNGGAFDRRGPDLNLPIVFGQKDFIESDLFTFLGFELIHDDALVLLDLVLMAGYLYNGVHGSFFS